MATGLAMEQFLIASVISVVLVILVTAFFYEILAHVWVLLPRWEQKPRRQILFTVLAVFVGHTICVWIFGLTYFLLHHEIGFGTLQGDTSYRLLDYVYFSAVSYSSLGLGDVLPTGGLRLLVGVEAIIGLILIGWSVTFTYLVTEKYLFHRRNPHR
jgi:hypothetical protein